MLTAFPVVLFLELRSVVHPQLHRLREDCNQCLEVQAVQVDLVEATPNLGLAAANLDLATTCNLDLETICNLDLAATCNLVGLEKINKVDPATKIRVVLATKTKVVLAQTRRIQ